MVETDNAGNEHMKSALEIALEKTQDIEAREDPNQLTDEEKGRVRDINREYDAQVAGVELKVSQRIREMIETHGEKEVQAHMQLFQQDLRAERDRINAERQTALAAFYESIGKSV